jgi:hypothetical protein
VIVEKVTQHYGIIEDILGRYYQILVASQKANLKDAANIRNIIRALFVIGLICRYYIKLGLKQMQPFIHSNNKLGEDNVNHNRNAYAKVLLEQVSSLNLLLQC